MRDQWWAFPVAVAALALTFICVYVVIAAVMRARQRNRTPRVNPDADRSYSLPNQPDDWRRWGPYRYPDEVRGKQSEADR